MVEPSTVKTVSMPTTCTFDGKVLTTGNSALRLFNETWLAIENAALFCEEVERRAAEHEYGVIGTWPWTCAVLPPTSQQPRGDILPTADDEAYEACLGDVQCDTRRLFEAQLYDIDKYIQGRPCGICSEDGVDETILYFGHGHWIHADCTGSLINAIENEVFDGAFTQALVDGLDGTSID